MLPYSSANETEHAGKADLDLALRGISEGSTEALETLYRCTSASIYGFAHSILRDHHDAQDVLHDCYVAVWNSAAGYRSQGKPLAWLLTIARNLCLQKLRERKKALAYDPEFPGIEGAAPGGLTLEDRHTLSACMEQLSDQERQIVTLHAVSGFRHREIAELLELPLPTVLSKYSRAIRKLKQYLQ